MTVRPNGPAATGPRGQGRRQAWGRLRGYPPLRWFTSSSSPQRGPRRSRMQGGMRKSASGLVLTQPPSGGACCVPRDSCGYAALQRDLAFQQGLGLAMCETRFRRASSHRLGPRGANQVVPTWCHVGLLSCPRCRSCVQMGRRRRRGTTLVPSPRHLSHVPRAPPPCRSRVPDAQWCRWPAYNAPVVRAMTSGQDTRRCSRGAAESAA